MGTEGEGGDERDSERGLGECQDACPPPPPEGTLESRVALKWLITGEGPAVVRDLQCTALGKPGKFYSCTLSYPGFPLSPQIQKLHNEVYIPPRPIQYPCSPHPPPPCPSLHMPTAGATGTPRNQPVLSFSGSQTVSPCLFLCFCCCLLSTPSLRWFLLPETPFPSLVYFY